MADHKLYKEFKAMTHLLNNCSTIDCLAAPLPFTADLILFLHFMHLP
jgi:hypothetical protein